MAEAAGERAAGDGVPQRLDGLQVGRALAALTVVVGHAVDHAYHPLANELWQLGARYGVTLFFVVSGFIMVQTTGRGSFDPRRFMSRRIRRVVPIYALVTVLVAVLALLVPRLFQRTTFDLGYLILSLLFVPTYDPAGSGGIWPLFRLGWTLNFEMFFYVVFAASFAFSAVRRAIALTVFFWACIILGQLVTFTAAIPRFYTQIDTLGFVAGVWLGVASMRGLLRLNDAAFGLLFAASAATLFFIMRDYPALRNVPVTQVWLVGVCASHVAMLLIAVDQRGWRAPRALIRVGDASYSMYLFHMFAIGVGSAIARRLPPDLMILGVAASAAGGIAIGLVAYRFVERPLNRLMRGARPLTAAQIGEEAATAPPGVPPPPMR